MKGGDLSVCIPCGNRKMVPFGSKPDLFGICRSPDCTLLIDCIEIWQFVSDALVSVSKHAYLVIGVYFSFDSISKGSAERVLEIHG